MESAALVEDSNRSIQSAYTYGLSMIAGILALATFGFAAFAALSGAAESMMSGEAYAPSMLERIIGYSGWLFLLLHLGTMLATLVLSVIGVFSDSRRRGLGLIFLFASLIKVAIYVFILLSLIGVVGDSTDGLDFFGIS